MLSDLFIRSLPGFAASPHGRPRTINSCACEAERLCPTSTCARSSTPSPARVTSARSACFTASFVRRADS